MRYPRAIDDDPKPFAAVLGVVLSAAALALAADTSAGGFADEFARMQRAVREARGTDHGQCSAAALRDRLSVIRLTLGMWVDRVGAFLWLEPLLSGLPSPFSRSPPPSSPSGRWQRSWLRMWSAA